MGGQGEEISNFGFRISDFPFAHPKTDFDIGLGFFVAHTMPAAAARTTNAQLETEYSEIGGC